jgi:diguanylate cyclase (GGDEF)-like protein
MAFVAEFCFMSSAPRIQKLHPANRLRIAAAAPREGRFARKPYRVREEPRPADITASISPQLLESRAQRAAAAEAAEKVWENVFMPYRARILYPIATLGSAIFLPLAIVDYFRGKVAISALLLCLVAMLLADAIALHRRKAPPVPFATLLIPGCAAVAFSMATQGIYGVLWSFPVVLLSFFVLPRRLANALSVVLLFAGMVLTWQPNEVGTTIRYGLALALSLVVINIMLGVLESLHARLLAQSLTDPLTGAGNRRQMDNSLAEVIERNRRSFAPAAALLIDIDHFKRINDRHGHEAGDEVLRSIVELVNDRRRKLDQIFRQGGEEFLLLLPDTRAGEAMGVAENLRKAIMREPILRDQPVTVSIGVGELHPGETCKDWMKRVDEALYAAKKDGRNRVAAADSVGAMSWVGPPMAAGDRRA